MALIRRRQLPPSEIPASSMADIAFLLLIFFITATVISRDTGIGLTLPEYLNEDQAVVLSPERVARFKVDESGSFFYDEAPVAEANIFSLLMPRLKEKISLPESKKLIISIETAAKTNYEDYIRLLDTVKRAYAEVRAAYAMQLYEKQIPDLSAEEFAALKDAVPILILLSQTP